MAIHIAPTDKHRDLDDFKAIEELLDDIDRRCQATPLPGWSHQARKASGARQIHT